MSLSTVRETGHIPVAVNREKTPVKIYYELHGHGDKHVVLIMGLNSSCLAWERQTKYLAETGKYTVLIFDNRGMGMSDTPSGLYSTSQMAQDVIDILDYLGWKKNVHLDGVSMGGMISLELASTWPERFASLVLTSTSAGRQVPPWKAVSTLSKMVLVSDPKLKIGHAVGLIYPSEWLKQKPEDKEFEHFETNQDMAVSAFLARIDRTRPQPFAGNLGQTAAALRHYVSDERLIQIKESGLPVIVCTGTWDNLVNPKNSYHLAKVLDCHLEVFEGSGHALPSEQATKYNQLLDQHFTKAAAALKSTTTGDN